MVIAPTGGRVGMEVWSTMMGELVGIPSPMGGPDPPNGGTWSEKQTPHLMNLKPAKGR